MVADPTDEALRLRAILQMTAVGQALLAGQEPVMADFYFDVARGAIPGMFGINKYGRATNVDSGVATDIWDGANATLDQDIWVAPTQARIHAINAASASDDGDPGGVGARTVRVWGLTSWDTPEEFEDVVLVGGGNVNTVKSYVIIHRMRVLTKGATNVNVGIIKATAASDNTITAQINAGAGSTQMVILGVPSTQKCFVGRLYGNVNRSAGATGAVDMALLCNPEPDSELLNFVTRHTFGLSVAGTSALTINYAVPKRFDGPCILKLQGTGGANDLDVSGGFDAVLENS